MIKLESSTKHTFAHDPQEDLATFGNADHDASVLMLIFTAVTSDGPQEVLDDFSQRKGTTIVAAARAALAERSCFLAADRAWFITGQKLRVDGCCTA